LKEAIPSMQKAVFLGWMRGGWEGSVGQVLREAAARLGISLAFVFPEGKPSEIERVFDAIAEQRPDAVLVSGEGDLYANRQLIAELAVKKRLYMRLAAVRARLHPA